MKNSSGLQKIWFNFRKKLQIYEIMDMEHFTEQIED